MKNFLCLKFCHLLAVLALTSVSSAAVDRTINLKNGEHYNGIFEVNGDGSNDWRAGVVICTNDPQKSQRISQMNQGIWLVVTLQITNGRQAGGAIKAFDVRTERAERIQFMCSQ